MVALSGLGYEYTELDRPRKSCTKNPAKEVNGYLGEKSSEMKFDIKIMSQKKGSAGVGLCRSCLGGKQEIQRLGLCWTDAEFVSFIKNMSYKMWIRPLFHANSIIDWVANPYRAVEITTESQYDAESGYVWVVGVQKGGSELELYC